MSTMTLEQVRDALRNMGGKPTNDYSRWADAIDAHLREREAAKAGVTDEIRAHASFVYRQTTEGDCNELGMLNALEAVAPMLSSARVPEAENALFSDYPKGATHYLPHVLRVRGKTQLTMRWFKKTDRGEWSEWGTDSDDEYPAFYPTSFNRCEPFPLLAAAPKRGECPLGCEDTCKENAHGCASECPKKRGDV